MVWFFDTGLIGLVGLCMQRKTILQLDKKCYRNNMNVHRTLMIAALLCLSMGFSRLAYAAVCDVDTDGDVDRLDLSLIISARNTPAGGPTDLRDADGDGNITVLDARTCVRQCNLSGCAIIDPTPPPPTDDAGQLDAPDSTSIQKAVKDVGTPSVATSDQLSTDIQGGTIVSGTEWKVTGGDTLYAIGRAVYPGDARKQARLRRDIMRLNPSVFANGANNMAVGVVLKLPDYVAATAAPPKVDEPVQVSRSATVEVTPKPTPKPATIVEPEAETQPEVVSTPKPTVKSEPAKQVKKESSKANEQPVFAPSRAESSAVVSLGYSLGGDKLVGADNWLDVTAGSGVHLRLGYERMPIRGSGFRLALGLQYNVVFDSSDKASFEDTYLQLAYQYRANPFVYGIGVVSHVGAKLEDEVNDITTDYDAANGAIVYLEYVGSGKIAGWGLSYTSLEIDEKDTATSVDASCAELYYNWRF